MTPTVTKTNKGVFFNPYSNFGFKKLFGEEGSKDLLIDFLNQILPEHHQIADFKSVVETALKDGMKIARREAQQEIDEANKQKEEANKQKEEEQKEEEQKNEF